MTRRTPPKPLSPALKRRVAAAHTALLARAGDDLAIIAEKRREIAGAFYEIGEALVRLRVPRVMAALELGSFAALCARVKIPVTTATSLIEIAERVKRKDALAWGQEKATAVVEVARALSSDGHVAVVDTRAIAKRLPRGTTLTSASAVTLKALATELRHAHHAAPGHARGRTTTPEERAQAGAITRALHAAGFHGASAAARATRPGQPSALELKGIPCDRAAAGLKAALGALSSGSRAPVKKRAGQIAR